MIFSIGLYFYILELPINAILKFPSVASRPDMNFKCLISENRLLKLQMGKKNYLHRIFPTRGSQNIFNCDMIYVKQEECQEKVFIFLMQSILEKMITDLSGYKLLARFKYFSLQEVCTIILNASFSSHF